MGAGFVRVPPSFTPPPSADQHKKRRLRRGGAAREAQRLAAGEESLGLELEGAVVGGSWRGPCADTGWGDCDGLKNVPRPQIYVQPEPVNETFLEIRSF